MRPLWPALGLLVVLVVGLFIWYGRTTRLMVSNARALGEGAEWAERLDTPADLDAYFAAHSADVSLLVVDLDAPADSAGPSPYPAALNPDTPRPAPGLTPWLLLADYLSRPPPPADSATVANADRYRLPSAGAASSTMPTALGPLLTHAWRASDPAAADALLDRLGRSRAEALLTLFGLAHTDPPLPRAGLFLSWSNHTLPLGPEMRRAQLERLGRPALADTVAYWLRRYVDDPVFRKREREVRATRGAELDLLDQRAFASATLPRTTARDWTRLIDLLLISSGGIAAVHDRLGIGVVDEGPFEAMLARSAAVPGHYTVAAVAQVRGRPGRRAAVLTLERLPTAVFYRLSRTGLADAYVLDQLTTRDE